MCINGKTAVAVARNYRDGQDPRECWEHEITQFTDSDESRKKGCPKSAFLGLCKDGYVDGIPKGTYLFSKSPNKEYAVAAAKLVLHEPSRRYTKAELWRISTKASEQNLAKVAENQNGQMDVIFALKKNGLLTIPN